MSLFADVSEFQVPVDDSYPHRFISIRSNDGTYRDHKFHHNYQWCCAAADAGRITGFIVYYYWRPNHTGYDTHVDMIGTPHPKMVSMIDLESGGNPAVDFTAQLNNEYAGLATWLGNPDRVIAYANRGDRQLMWQNPPSGLRWVGAGYGQNPNLPNQIAHQYTDGAAGGGQGLPLGAPPFGPCDMNSADNLSAEQLAETFGLTTQGWLMALNDQEQQELLDGVRFIRDQLGPWPQLGKNAKGEDRTLVDAFADDVRYVRGQVGPWPQLGQNAKGENRTLVDAFADEFIRET